MMKRSLSIMLCIAITLSLVIAVPAMAVNITGYVAIKNGYLNVRAEPDKNSESIGKLYKNQEVTILDVVGDWYQIQYEGVNGYVHHDYISYFPVIEETLSSSNIINLKVRYVGNLMSKAEAYPLKSKTRNCYVPAGPIAVFGIDGNYAIIAKDRQLLRVRMSMFNGFTKVDPEGDICDEAVVAAYTTFFSTSNNNRANNIKIGAKAMQVKLKPGEEYSFNRIVGKRTPEKGYLLAGAYSNGETVQDYGGGVCQLSSTLYAAIRQNEHFLVTERYEHNPEVKYLPLGMDATVNWNNRDLKFINNYDCNILISVNIDGGRLTVIVQKEPI